MLSDRRDIVCGSTESPPCSFLARISWKKSEERQVVRILKHHTCLCIRVAGAGAVNAVGPSSNSLGGTTGEYIDVSCVNDAKDLTVNESKFFRTVGFAGLDIHQAKRMFQFQFSPERLNQISGSLFSRQLHRWRKHFFGESDLNFNQFHSVAKTIKEDGGVFEMKFDDFSNASSFVLSTNLMQQMIAAYDDLCFGKSYAGQLVRGQLLVVELLLVHAWNCWWWDCLWWNCWWLSFCFVI